MLDITLMRLTTLNTATLLSYQQAKYVSEKGVYNDTLKAVFDVVSGLMTPSEIDSVFEGTPFDSLYSAPTAKKPFVIIPVDTAVVKYITIMCPLDDKMLNHGKLQDGELSWQDEEDRKLMFEQMEVGRKKRKMEQDSLRARD